MRDGFVARGGQACEGQNQEETGRERFRPLALSVICRKELEGGALCKCQKVEGSALHVSRVAWEAFERDVQAFEVQQVQGESKSSFALIEAGVIDESSVEWRLVSCANLLKRT